MPNIDPRFLLVFCLIFVGLAVFNLYLGIKRLRQAHAQGEKQRWYKQLSILAGIEYLLLALAFVGSLSISNGWLPASVRPVALPIYLTMLVLAVILAGVVVYQNTKARRARARLTAPAASVTTTTVTARNRSAEEQEQLAQRRRQRRQKAAVARRRRAGKA
ncbi:MAG TPA: hypothetical protein VL485_21020 [Ktedonobacteraceae bacterium]|jgi:uncharacterized membrane protein YhaH (DUF805 family)|nr:hypothetical protein [Ktedonobacteraceae bacterium]